MKLPPVCYPLTILALAILPSIMADTHPPDPMTQVCTCEEQEDGHVACVNPCRNPETPEYGHRVCFYARTGVRIVGMNEVYIEQGIDSFDARYSPDDEARGFDCAGDGSFCVLENVTQLDDFDCHDDMFITGTALVHNSNTHYGTYGEVVDASFFHSMYQMPDYAERKMKGLGLVTIAFFSGLGWYLWKRRSEGIENVSLPA